VFSVSDRSSRHSFLNVSPFRLEQFDILQEYFLVYLPSKQPKSIKKNSRYDHIKEILMSNISKVRFNFILFLCRSIFDRFLTWFQKEGPLIHLLYFELSDLYRTVLLSFLRPEHVGSTAGGPLLDIDFKLSEKQLPTKMLQIGKLKVLLDPSEVFM
jgi:hypothetical protein